MSKLKNRLNKTAGVDNETIAKNLQEAISRINHAFDDIDYVVSVIDNMDTKAAFNAEGIDANSLIKELDEYTSRFDTLSRDVKNVLDKLEY